MKLEDLIRALQSKLDEADTFLDGGDVDESREQLRAAKALLDDEFIKD